MIDKLPQKTWQGKVPAMCEMSGEEITDRFIDGCNRAGQWCIMSPTGHMQYGRGLGVGKGQEYTKVHGKWVKTRG
jgi:hypothetical protein